MSAIPSQIVPGSNLGFFGKLEFIDGTVLKKYKGVLNREEVGRLKTLHDNFVTTLKAIGITVPKTTFRFVKHRKSFFVEIEQERFLPHELAGEIIKKGSSEDVCVVVSGIVSDAVLFLKSKYCGVIGFHPSIRNYAVRGGTFYMLDTFPPFSDRKTSEQIMKQHAPTLIFRLIMNCFPFLLACFSKEYYDSVDMLYGIYATACRLRPELAHDIYPIFRNIQELNEEENSKLVRIIEKKGYRQVGRWRVVSFLKRF